jgi:DNA-binding winged helix-turn-helix (wHTH) protein/predicted Zn-dependent protease
VLRFDAFTLDLSRCVLRRDDATLPLRPKPFDMLRYLAANPGRLLSKDELLSAVWPDATVSEDALVRCIRDVREALGDRAPLVKTVPKRGYLFDTEVKELAAGVASPLASAPLPAPPAGLGAPSLPAGMARPLEHVRRSVRGRPAAALACGLIAVAVAGVATWGVLRTSPHVGANAAHYAVLGRTILDTERSRKATGEALALFDKALALDPDWVPALLGYARVMIIDVGERWLPQRERAARLDQADVALKRALELEPGNAGVHHLLGKLLRLRGDPAGALAAIERALVLGPDSAWARAEIGRNKIELGRSEEGLADIEMAVRLDPGEALIHVWYGWAGMAALHAGRHETAVAWLLKARQASPTYAIAMPLLAVAYGETGKEAEGRALIAQYLELSPTVTIEAVKREFPPHNPAVAEQRLRIVAVLRRLGLPDRSRPAN